MKNRLRVLAVAAAVALSPALAGASTVGVTSSTLELSIGALPPVPLQGNLSSLSVSSGAGTFNLSPGAFGPVDLPLPASLFTGVGQISGLTLAGFGNGTQPCTGTTGPLSCAGGLAGSSLVNILQLFNLSIPLSVVGAPGASTIAGSGGITITVLGQGWTAGVASVTGVTTETPGTAPINTVTMMGSDNRTPGHGGTLKLVSGFQAITNVAGTLPGFAVQSFSFMPEPARLLSAAAAVGAIWLLAQARRRRK